MPAVLSHFYSLRFRGQELVHGETFQSDLFYFIAALGLELWPLCIGDKGSAAELQLSPMGMIHI